MAKNEPSHNDELRIQRGTLDSNHSVNTRMYRDMLTDSDAAYATYSKQAIAQSHTTQATQAETLADAVDTLIRVSRGMPTDLGIDAFMTRTTTAILWETGISSLLLTWQ